MSLVLCSSESKGRQSSVFNSKNGRLDNVTVSLPSMGTLVDSLSTLTRIHPVLFNMNSDEQAPLFLHLFKVEYNVLKNLSSLTFLDRVVRDLLFKSIPSEPGFGYFIHTRLRLSTERNRKWHVRFPLALTLALRPSDAHALRPTPTQKE